MDNVPVQLFNFIKENYLKYYWHVEDPSLTEVYLGSLEESYLIINKNDQDVLIERYIWNDGEQDVRGDLQYLSDSAEGKSLADLIDFVLAKLKEPDFIKKQGDNTKSLVSNSTELINKYFN